MSNLFLNICFFFSTSTPENEDLNRVLLIVHGVEQPTEVTLPGPDGVTAYVRLWNSADDEPGSAEDGFVPGQTVPVSATSMQLFRAV